MPLGKSEAESLKGIPQSTHLWMCKGLVASMQRQPSLYWYLDDSRDAEVLVEYLDAGLGSMPPEMQFVHAVHHAIGFFYGWFSCQAHALGTPPDSGLWDIISITAWDYYRTVIERGRNGRL